VEEMIAFSVVNLIGIAVLGLFLGFFVAMLFRGWNTYKELEDELKKWREEK
jgi:hypothetical protein